MLEPALTHSIFRAHLEYPDRRPRQRTFHIQGWAVSSAAIFAAEAFGPDGTVVPLDLRARPDVAKTFPTVPSATGFFGVGPASLLDGDTLRIRFRTELGTEDGAFSLEPEPQAELDLRGEKLHRLFRFLVCVNCRSSFPDGSVDMETYRFSCPSCGRVYDCSDGYYDFLTPEEHAELAPSMYGNISTNHYDQDALRFVYELRDGLILDCGAGLRLTGYPHVVNLEIVPYRTTDVLALNERLPFADATFDGVLSLAVLEHVRNPFASAKEICRVLKPGGRLLAVVPLLAPVHAYPDHFYNMTAEGLANLFAPDVEIIEQKVPDSGLPIWALTWMLRSWVEGLPLEARDSFLRMRVADLLGEGPEYLGRDFVASLPLEKNFELASTTLLHGRRK